MADWKRLASGRAPSHKFPALRELLISEDPVGILTTWEYMGEKSEVYVGVSVDIVCEFLDGDLHRFKSRAPTYEITEIHGAPVSQHEELKKQFWETFDFNKAKISRILRRRLDRMLQNSKIEDLTA